MEHEPITRRHAQRILEDECDPDSPTVTIFCSACDRRRGYVFETSLGAVWVPIEPKLNVRALDFAGFITVRRPRVPPSIPEQEVSEYQALADEAAGWRGVRVVPCPRCGEVAGGSLANLVTLTLPAAEALAAGRATLAV